MVRCWEWTGATASGTSGGYAAISRSLGYGDHFIHRTGHSLGGALATLCALDVQYNFPDKQVSCYTFGSPKVGNSYFKDSFNKRVPQTYRFVNSADTVPALPPGGFEHVGIFQHIGPTASVVESLIDKVLDVVDDHFPYNYIKSLQEFFNK